MGRNQEKKKIDSDVWPPVINSEYYIEWVIMLHCSISGINYYHRSTKPENLDQCENITLSKIEGKIVVCIKHTGTD